MCKDINVVHYSCFLSSLSQARMLRDCNLAMQLMKLAKKDNWFLVETLPFFL